MSALEGLQLWLDNNDLQFRIDDHDHAIDAFLVKNESGQTVFWESSKFPRAPMNIVVNSLLTQESKQMEDAKEKLIALLDQHADLTLLVPQRSEGTTMLQPLTLPKRQRMWGSAPIDWKQYYQQNRPKVTDIEF